MDKHFACPQGHRWSVPIANNAPLAVEMIACPQCGGTAQTLAPDAEDSLPNTERTAGASAVWETPQRPAGIWPGQIGPYAIAEEIARGGMGVVLRARDPRFERALAVKLLLRPDVPGLAARFRAEAGITARLQHPGIPPVHDQGALPDGRPYFAMKLIQGRTLHQLLKERATPAADLPRFLAIFAQICQTLGYAHSQGVIHRDLKPDNIMVGAFGEVQVMDWGLAKQLGAGRDAAGTEQPAATIDLDPGLTQAGTVMGTPGYMPPEQAAGLVAQLDARSDVFGLGAILCVILTGQPPYTGATTADIIAQTLAGRTEELHGRLDACGGDAELVALAKRALSPRQEDRPADGGVLAEAIAAYQAALQERLQAAELARASAQVKALEERKRRRLTVALAASLLGLVLVGGGVAWWLDREARRQEAEQRQEVLAALNQAAGFQQERRWPDARAALQLARNRLGSGDDPELRQRVEQGEKWLDLVARLDAIRLKKALLFEGRIDWAGVYPEYAATFQAAGLGAIGDDPDAVARRIAELPIRAQVVAALDDWAACVRVSEKTKLTWLLEVARRADPDPQWGDRFRDPVVCFDRAALEKLAQSVEPAKLSPALLTVLAHRLKAHRSDAVPFLRSAQTRHPSDFWLNFDLATLLHDTHPADAMGYYRATLAMRPDNGVVLTQLGGAYLNNNWLDDALFVLEKAVALEPSSAAARNNLAIALQRKGRLDEAIVQLEQAVAAEPRAKMYINLATALKAKGRLKDAVTACEQAVAREPKFAEAHLSLSTALHDDGQHAAALAACEQAIALDSSKAVFHNMRGVMLRSLGRMAEAIPAYEKAIALDPKNGSAHNNLGNSLRATGQLERAIAAYKEAVRLDPQYETARVNLEKALRQQQKSGDPLAALQQAAVDEPRDARVHFQLGVALLAKKRAAEAVSALKTAAELEPRDAETHFNLGLAYSAHGKIDEAITSLQQAVARDPKHLKACTALGNLWRDKTRYDEASIAYQQAVQLGSKHPPTYYHLAGALRATGKLEEGIKTYRQAIALEPSYADAYCGLGLALRVAGRFDEALDAFKQGHTLGMKQPGWRHPSAQWLKQTQRLLELEGQLPGYLNGQRKASTVAEWLELVQLCRYKDFRRAGVQFYTEAFALDRALADDPSKGVRAEAAGWAALAAAGKGKDAGALSASEAVRLREQALSWLTADLAAWTRLVERGESADRQAAVKALRQWQTTAEFATMREPEHLGRLPEPERERWRRLWSAVADLAQRGEPR